MKYEKVFAFGEKYFAVACHIKKGNGSSGEYPGEKIVNDFVQVVQLDANLNKGYSVAINLAPGEQKVTVGIADIFMMDEQILTFFYLPTKHRGKRQLMVCAYNVVDQSKKFLRLAASSDDVESASDRFKFIEENGRIYIYHYLKRASNDSSSHPVGSGEYCVLDKELNFTLSEGIGQGNGELMYKSIIPKWNLDLSLYNGDGSGGKNVTLIKSIGAKTESLDFGFVAKKFVLKSVQSTPDQKIQYYFFIKMKNEMDLDSAVVVKVLVTEDSFMLMSKSQYGHLRMEDGNRVSLTLGYNSDPGTKAYRNAKQYMVFNSVYYDYVNNCIVIFHEFRKIYTVAKQVETKHYTVDSKHNQRYSHSTWTTQTEWHYVTGPYLASFITNPAAIQSNQNLISESHDSKVTFISLLSTVQSEKGNIYYMVNGELLACNPLTGQFFNLKLTDSDQKVRFLNHTEVITHKDKLFMIHTLSSKKVQFSMAEVE
ncbi:MAG: hypothetical protein KG003_04160 [Bacteroidetes bacterium]|nr:hypothetical protein [Bacteroidota bacterium]